MNEKEPARPWQYFLLFLVVVYLVFSGGAEIHWLSAILGFALGGLTTIFGLLWLLNNMEKK